jgi:hypothetical protein
VAKKQTLPRIVLRPPGKLTQPGQLGGSVGNYVPPGAQYDYKHPSVFAQHKVVTGVFAALLIGLLIYWAMAPKHDPRFAKPDTHAASAAASDTNTVYVQPLQSKP